LGYLSTASCHDDHGDGGGDGDGGGGDGDLASEYGNSNDFYLHSPLYA